MIVYISYGILWVGLWRDLSCVALWEPYIVTHIYTITQENSVES